MSYPVVSAALTYARAYRSLHQALSKDLSNFGLTLLEFSFLMTVMDSPNQTMTTYANQMSFDAPHISQLAQTLVSRDYLVISPSPTDKRIKCLDLTELGQQQTVAANHHLLKELTRIFKDVSPTDIETHLDVLHHIITMTET